MIPIATYSSTCRFLDNVRTNLDQFVENNLGFGNLSRGKTIIEIKIDKKLHSLQIKGLLKTIHTTDLSVKLFNVHDLSVITIWDGTYVYIQKSANYSFQKATYSMHKGGNLVKMMMVVSTTGYIIETFGPY